MLNIPSGPPPSYEESVYIQICQNCSSPTGTQCSYCKNYYCTLHLTSGTWKNTSGNTMEGILCNLCYERLVDKPERERKKTVIPKNIRNSYHYISILLFLGLISYNYNNMKFLFIETNPSRWSFWVLGLEIPFYKVFCNQT